MLTFSKEYLKLFLHKLLFFSLYCLIFKVLAATLATAFIYYHNFLILSTTFLKFFKIFLLCPDAVWGVSVLYYTLF
ncbi:MAG: hypothetical protein E7483_06980 [Ruminococcaceae bacterium]|nr:hypothetical protein [Oscillospiraceae bacterium]